MVENIRRQLMENNYDYLQSQEQKSANSNGRIIARAHNAQQGQVNWPAYSVVPTMRIKKQHRPPPSTYTFSSTQKKLMHRTPKEPHEANVDPPDDGRPQAAVRFEQVQLNNDDAHRGAQKKYSQVPELFYEAKLKQKQNSDEFLPKVNSQYTYRQLMSSSKSYKKIKNMQIHQQFQTPLNADSKYNDGSQENNPDPPLVNSNVKFTYSPSSSRMRTTKRPQNAVRGQPYPKIDIKYNQPLDANNEEPQTSNFYYNKRQTTDKDVARPQRFKIKKHQRQPQSTATTSIMHINKGMQDQPPNIRVKNTVPQLTSSQKSPNMHKERQKLVRRKVKKTKRTTSFKAKKPRKVLHNSKASSIPDSMWEEDGGPYGDDSHIHHNQERGDDLSLAKKYHFRAEEVTNLPDPQVKISNSTIKISVMKLKRKDGRRSGSYRKIIKEESDRGIALMVLDGEPLPEFKLPAECRQYMEGSPEHENLHELA